MTEVKVAVKARLTPIRLQPNDILLLEFIKETNAEVMEAAVAGIQGALRRAGQVNEVVSVSAWVVKVRPVRKKREPRRVNGKHLRSPVAKRRPLG